MSHAPFFPRGAVALEPQVVLQQVRLNGGHSAQPTVQVPARHKSMRTLYPYVIAKNKNKIRDYKRNTLSRKKGISRYDVPRWAGARPCRAAAHSLSTEYKETASFPAPPETYNELKRKIGVLTHKILMRTLLLHDVFTCERMLRRANICWQSERSCSLLWPMGKVAWQKSNRQLTIRRWHTYRTWKRTSTIFTFSEQPVKSTTK